MSDSTDSARSSASSTGWRVLKWGGGVAAGLAVLVLGAALVLPRLFTSEQLKGYVVPPLEEATGRQVEIDAIRLRVLWTPAVSVSGFRLADREGYGPEPAVEAGALNVEVALWPLFRGAIEPTAVELVDPVVRYRVDAEGASNFDDLLAEDDTTADEGGMEAAPVSNFRTTGARIHYVDQRTGEAVDLAFDARLSALPDGRAVTSTGTVDIRSLRALLPDVRADTMTLTDAQIDYDVRAALETGRVEVSEFLLQTAPLTMNTTGTITRLNVRPTLDLSVETREADLAQLSAFVPAAAVEGLNPTGSVAFTTAITGPLPDSTGALDSLSIDGTGRLAGVGADYEGEALLRDLEADLALSLDEVALTDVQGQLLGASMNGAVRLKNAMDDPTLDLQLETGDLDLATLAALAPPEQVAGYNPQGTLRLNTTVAGPLPEGTETLDRLTIDGIGELASFGADYEGTALLRDLSADLSFSTTSATARSINGQLLGRAVEGEVTVRDLMEAPRVEGRLAGTADLAELTAVTASDEGEGSMALEGTAEYDVRFAGPIEDPDAIRPTGQVRLADVRYPYESFRHPIQVPDATVELTGTGLAMDRFTLQSGPQDLTLEATVRNLFPLSKGLAETDPALAADFALTSDRLDLVELYPEADTGEAGYSQLFAAHLSGSKVNGKSPESVAEETYGGTEVPAYAVEGRVEIGTLLNEPQRYDDLSMDVQMDDRRLEVRNLSASTYGGDLTGTLTLDQRGASAAGPRDGTVWLASAAAGRVPTRPAAASDLTYDFELQGAEAGAVLDDWTSLGRLVTGTLTFDADGNTALTDGLLPETAAFTAVGQSLVSDGGLSLNTGPASALVNALGLPGTSLRQFERLGGPFTIEEGRFRVNAWEFGGTRFDGTMEGALGLGGSVDLEMTMDLPLSMLQNSTIASRIGGDGGGLGDLLTKLMGGDADDDTVPVSLRFGGTMGNPSVQVLNRDAIGERIRSIAKEQGLNRLRDIFGGGGGNR